MLYKKVVIGGESVKMFERDELVESKVFLSEKRNRVTGVGVGVRLFLAGYWRVRRVEK